MTPFPKDWTIREWITELKGAILRNTRKRLVCLVLLPCEKMDLRSISTPKVSS